MTDWVPYEDKYIIKAQKLGKTTRAIAVDLKRTKNEVIGRINRIKQWGVPHYTKVIVRKNINTEGVHSPETLMLVKTLWKNIEWSRADICTRTGLNEVQVDRLAKKLKLGGRPLVRKRGFPAFKWPISLWPDDMWFYDHPKTVTNERTGVRYIRGER